MTEDLPRFIRDLLSSPPAAGEGCHRWMFSTARYLHVFRSTDEIHELLQATLHGCGRRIPQRELMAAISDAKKVAWVPGEKQDGGRGIGASVLSSAWPKFNLEKYNHITADGLGAYDLWETSPVRFMDDKSYTEEIIDALFPDNPWLCCGMSNEVFDALRREDWRQHRSGLNKMQFIVPNSCIGKFGITKEGKESAHCLDNTGPREYLVIEQDQGSQDQQCAVCEYLAKEKLPLRMVLSSGGKSLHAWFDCDGKDEVYCKEFMCSAVALGADPATWVRSQFVRMPDGLRDTGVRQSVFYFNPL